MNYLLAAGLAFAPLGIYIWILHTSRSSKIAPSAGKTAFKGATLKRLQGDVPPNRKPTARGFGRR